MQCCRLKLMTTLEDRFESLEEMEELGEGEKEDQETKAEMRHSLTWTHALLSHLVDTARRSFWAVMVFTSRTLIYLGLTYFSGLVIGFTLLVIGEFMIRDGKRIKIASVILVRLTKATVGAFLRFLGQLAVFLAVVYLVTLQVATFVFFGIGLHNALEKRLDQYDPGTRKRIWEIVTRHEVCKERLTGC